MNHLAQKIATEIASQGPIPFARFMELALYCPVYGYYEKEEDTPGQAGDYYTSVSVGPLFGQLLAFQFADWLAEHIGPAVPGGPVPLARPFQMVEAGAHDGQLAQDILDWLRLHRSALFNQLEYWIIEPSSRRRSWQQTKLHSFGDQVRWAADFDALTQRLPRSSTRASAGIRGIIFSNELLDAFPIHRLGWDAQRRHWFEWGVTVENGRFVWTRLTSEHRSSPQEALRAPALPADLLEVLPDGFTTEVCPAATQWWKAAAGLLQWGKLLTIDYGLTAEQYFAPQRMQGTLRAYHRHVLGSDVLARPGEQDITGHVNLTELCASGELGGLQTESLLSQRQFLTPIAERIWQRLEAFGQWSKAETRQFQTLTDPEHFGTRFSVLVQCRK